MVAQVIDKATGKTREISQDVIDLDAPSVVKLDIDHTEVASVERQGNDLLIRLRSGEEVRIVDYYDKAHPNSQSDVVFQDHDGRFWGISHDGALRLYEISDIKEVLGVAVAAEGGGMSLLVPALGLLGGAGLVAAVAGGGGGGKGSGGGDNNAPAAPGLALGNDTGASAVDRITSNGALVVSGVETGATYQYSTDGGVTWQQGTGTGFTLAEGSYSSVRVRQTDAAGNVSPETSLGPVTVDATILPPTVALASDTATPGDGLTSDGTVNVGGLEPGATWEYSLDGGATWTTGSGTSFELAEGTYTGVQVRSTDVAGNV
ncbi:BapA/Bap/LapF family prefix-like domain-containing protein, partial [Novosphingobium gossypii]|uniref:BapA/Bap/LapF family prefix-like domain-containing protein n=1 Tax=Novosphingobium gossypii TaxID=1604774 RepID=UPI003D20D06D